MSETYMNDHTDSAEYIMVELETYTPDEIKTAMMELGFRLFYTDFDSHLLPKLREMRRRVYETYITTVGGTNIEAATPESESEE